MHGYIARPCSARESLAEGQRSVENVERLNFNETPELRNYNNMRVLVTGHLGYIGTVLVPMLQREGYEIVGMDSDLYRSSTFIDGIADVPNIKKDIRDATLEDFDGIDAVCHLAALSNDPLGNIARELT